VLSRLEKPVSNSEIELGVIAELEVPPHLVSLIHSGNRTELQYRLAWARTKAKSSGWLTSPKRETWEITPSGKAQL
jgi:restriction system protein